MSVCRTILPCVLAVIWSSVAIAQETPAEPQASPEAGSAENGPAAPGSADDDSGEMTEREPGVDDGPQEGEAYVAERFTDWTLTCIRTNIGNDPCRFMQALENEEGGRIAQVAIIPLPGEERIPAAMVVETPLGTLLRVPRSEAELGGPGGLRMQVDDGDLMIFQFSFCNVGGCVAEIGMEPPLVEAFRRGSIAEITIWSSEAPDLPVVLPLSLMGFTAGFDRVSEIAAGTSSSAE